MYVKRHYSLWMTVRWSRRDLFYALLYSLLVVALYEITSLPLTLPWEPISVIGIAVAFYLGFKNNSAYDRTWEARKIWGAIVNDSRTFATGIISQISLVNTEEDRILKRTFIHRHLAWLMALKHVLYKHRSWEHGEDSSTLQFAPSFAADMVRGSEYEINKYVSPEELALYKSKSNMPSQILKRQSEELNSLYIQGIITDFKHVWLHQLIGKLYDDQGMCERIKNFPLPRQYASTALWMNYFFCALIPFGMLSIFEASAVLHIWFTIPFSGMIIWIFFLMDRIGDYSENPFEGAYNDVPISSIARAIEIDLLEMIDEENIPPVYPVENGFSM